MLWLDMGLGKTVAALTVVDELMDRAEVYGCLVLGPLRVMQSVWRQEAEKWAHLAHLQFSAILGTRDDRTRAAVTPAQVYLCNYENLRWLADLWTVHYLSKGRYPPVNMVIYDEVSKLKDSANVRHTALQRLLPFLPYRVGLTGTPAGNGYKDLHGQFMAVDSGERLGTSKTSFHRRFLRPDNPGSPFAKQVIVPGAKGVIHDLVRDITVQMRNEDYLELPPVVDNVVELELPRDLRRRYKDMEKTMWLELDSGRGVESFNVASLTNRCLQFAQGAVYLQPGEDSFEEIHQIKLDALDDIIEEAAGKPVLIIMAFRHDGHRILGRHKDYAWIDSRMSERKFNDTLHRWVCGYLPGIVMHPASAGHGIDRLKDGPVDDLVWFGHTWSLEQYLQTIARLQRQGRTRPIRMHHLVMDNTVQVAQRIALDAKAEEEEGLKAALNEYRRAA